jgi:hypothetical protein
MALCRVPLGLLTRHGWFAFLDERVSDGGRTRVAVYPG